MAMPDRVKILAPQGAIALIGTWGPGARAGDFVFFAGMRGIDRANDRLVEGEEARIRQAFMNMKFLAESEGASLTDCVRLTVFVTDMSRLSKSRRIFGKAVRAAHHCRGHRAEPGRLFRGGRHLLYTKRPMNLQMPLGWRCFLGYIYL